MLAMGRPSSYTQETADHICAQLASGMPLTKICAADGMPDVATVYRWLVANATFRETYARAREDQADTLADQIIEIADDGKHDDIDGELCADNIQRSRLRVDARKFIAAKLKPKKYGDLVKHEHGGADGAPIPVSIAVTYAKPDGDTS